MPVDRKKKDTTANAADAAGIPAVSARAGSQCHSGSVGKRDA